VRRHSTSVSPSDANDEAAQTTDAFRKHVAPKQFPFAAAAAAAAAPPAAAASDWFPVAYPRIYTPAAVLEPDTTTTPPALCVEAAAAVVAATYAASYRLPNTSV